MKTIFLGQENVFGMVLKENHKLIGTIGCLADPRRTNPRVLMLGYSMSETYWGKGLMTEAAKALINKAFSELPIDLISCTCYNTNSRSQRVIQKCGFAYEGCLMQCELRYDGAVMDVNCYSLTRAAYENSKKQNPK